MRANDVAAAIIERVPGLTSIQLQKLLYYAQAWHLAITDKPLFEERCKAWANGPVVPQVWHDRQSYASRLPHGETIPELSETAAAILELVVGAYGDRSGDELSALTHDELPWLQAREGLPADAPSSNPIDERAMAEFYRAHRRLGGRTAADLASIGIYTRDFSIPETFDIDALLEQLDDDPDDDPGRQYARMTRPGPPSREGGPGRSTYDHARRTLDPAAKAAAPERCWSTARGPSPST